MNTNTINITKVRDVVNKLEEFRDAVQFKLIELKVTNDNNTISASAEIEMSGINMTIYYNTDLGKWF